MTNTAKHAASELLIHEMFHLDPLNPDSRSVLVPFTNEIVALAEKFGNSGQSGGSAPFVATALSQAIKKLLLQEPISPITGLEQEWNDVSHLCDGDILFQNNRCSAIFKRGIDSPATYVDAISWKSSNGICYHSNSVNMKDGSKIGSVQLIKSFPFTPKTFYIDIIKVEVEKDNWEFYVKDEKQLKRVFKYYDRYYHK